MITTRKATARCALAAALSLAAATTGCQTSRNGAGENVRGERFPADDQTRPVDRFIDVQSAAAARTDATLNAYHFDGQGGLNSLGRRKLDLMLRDDAALPLVVYLDLSRAEVSARAAGVLPPSADAHRDSVRVYLADRGVSDEQLELRSGPNLGYNHPARDGLRGLKALQGEDAESSYSDNSVQNRAAGSGAAELFGNPPNK